MRRYLAWTVATSTLLSMASTCVAQQPATKAAPRVGAPTPKTAPTSRPPVGSANPQADVARAATDARAREELDNLLDEWEKRSKKILSLNVEFERADRSLKWGDQYYLGKAILKSPDFACLEFQKALSDANGKPVYTQDEKGRQVLKLEKTPDERIVCNGVDILQYKWDEKAIYVYPLNKEVRQKALQQGPLPFLFNMKAGEAKKRYGMTLLQQDEREYLIAIVPREEIDKQSFKQAFIWLNKENFLPNKLQLYMVGEKEKSDFRFTLIAPNKAIDDNFFHPSTNLPGWKVINNPEPDAAPPAQRTTGAPAPARQPKAAASAGRPPVK